MSKFDQIWPFPQVLSLNFDHFSARNWSFPTDSDRHRSGKNRKNRVFQKCPVTTRKRYFRHLPLALIREEFPKITIFSFSRNLEIREIQEIQDLLEIPEIPDFTGFCRFPGFLQNRQIPASNSRSLAFIEKSIKNVNLDKCRNWQNRQNRQISASNSRSPAFYWKLPIKRQIIVF